jgi:DNA repair protein RecO (recombination protein O)
MQHKTRGIVLHALKYGDNGLIVKIFTHDAGLKSFMIKGFRSSKGRMRASFFMPLTLLTLDISGRQSASAFHLMKDASCHEPLHRIHTDFGRQAIALFIAEVLYKTIPDEAAHPELFGFVEDLLRYLNESETVPALLPHYFLVRYSQHLGLYPNANGETKSTYFDMRDGIFHDDSNLHSDFMTEEESHALKLVLETPLEALQETKMNSALRNKLLLGLLHYYKIHLLNLREIKSHAVLAEVLRN